MTAPLLPGQERAHPGEIAGPPDWLRARLDTAMAGLAGSPDQDAAIEAVAARHGRPAGEVLLTSGAAEAYRLIAATLRPRRAVCVYPLDAAQLRLAGLAVEQAKPDPDQLPADADLVVLASPLPAEALGQLARPGRVVVVDEARPVEGSGLGDRRDVPGLLVVRGLAEVWGLAGLGAGYLLGDAAAIGALRAAQPPCAVGSLALTALAACSQPDAVAWAGRHAGSRPAAVAGPTAHELAAPGTVTLIGAGPGGPDLITVRGWRALHAADVVIADRLADPGLTSELRPGVRLIHAGKAPGAQQLSQDEINRLLVEHATAGRRVVRLKGGDPFVLGRGGEEAAACAAAGIACSVIPGLSSATAGPALAGIPLTHRDVGLSFSVVSGHLPPGDPDSRVNWPALAAGTDTLVLLMAVRNLPAIAAHLIACGRPGATPAACVENAGTRQQRVIRLALADLAGPAAAPVRNPAVIIIGPTV